MSDLRAARRHPELHPPKPERVVLSWVTPGHVNARFMDSILKLMYSDANRPLGQQRLLAKGAGYHYLVSGPRIASARNDLVRRFLDTPRYEAEWLLMIDTDMVFEPSDVDKLLAVADPVTRPIVGALCFGGGKGQLFPTMYRLQDPKLNDGKVIDWVREWEPGELVQVDATGAAFMLMHRSALEKIRKAEREGQLMFPEPAPWYAETQYKGREFGEDWTFCIRAGVCGIPIFVHTGASIGHEKPVILDEQVWRNMQFNLHAQGLPEGEDDGPSGEAQEETITIIGEELEVVA